MRYNGGGDRASHRSSVSPMDSRYSPPNRKKSRCRPKRCKIIICNHYIIWDTSYIAMIIQ